MRIDLLIGKGGFFRENEYERKMQLRMMFNCGDTLR